MKPWTTERRLPGLATRLELLVMKAEIHPEYVLSHVHCSCGNEFYTRSTTPELHVEADGSVNLYFSPEPPNEHESNWVPTNSDGRF